MFPSSSGPGRPVLIRSTGVRFPQGTPREQEPTGLPDPSIVLAQWPVFCWCGSRSFNPTLTGSIPVRVTKCFSSPKLTWWKRQFEKLKALVRSQQETRGSYGGSIPPGAAQAAPSSRGRTRPVTNQPEVFTAARVLREHEVPVRVWSG